jgi:hypothetical protein
MGSSDKHVYNFGLSLNKISTNKEVCYLGEVRSHVIYFFMATGVHLKEKRCGIS